MMYKITIEEVYEVEGNSYPKTEKVYEQKVGDLNMPAIIAVVNGLDKID